MKTIQHTMLFLFLFLPHFGFLSTFFKKLGLAGGRWSALRCSDVKLPISAYRVFHVPFPSWDVKCSMLDNLLLSCLNIVSDTTDMFQYTAYVLSLLGSAAVSAICCQYRRLTPETNIGSRRCMDAAVVAFIPDVCCFGAACSLT